jgi:hypothetical protein
MGRVGSMTAGVPKELVALETSLFLISSRLQAFEQPWRAICGAYIPMTYSLLIYIRIHMEMGASDAAGALR